MSRLELRGLRRTYGAAVAVECVDLDLAQGELVALLGPSGCGKTTTLRMVAGFVRPSAGQVLIGGQDVTRAPPHARDTGMVFQGFALFPHMTVAANVAFGLEMRRVKRAERERRVADALRLVQLGAMADRRPDQLSGGQQQRVALARALVVNPAVFLLDEPLSALDARLRAELRVEIRELQQRLGLTTLFVTHDQEEALTLADRLVVMDRGRVRQVGTPREVYEHPADLFVAGFLGRCSVLRGEPAEPGRFVAGGIDLPCAPATVAGRHAMMLRPEHVALHADQGWLPGRVHSVTYLGGQTDWLVDTAAGKVLASRPTPDAPAFGSGDPVVLHWPEHLARILPDPEGDQP